MSAVVYIGHTDGGDTSLRPACAVVANATNKADNSKAFIVVLLSSDQMLSDILHHLP